MTTTVREVVAAHERADALRARCLVREGKPPVYVRTRGTGLEVLDEDGGCVLTLPAWLAGLHVFGRQADVDALIVSLVDQVEAIAARCLRIGQLQERGAQDRVRAHEVAVVDRVTAAVFGAGVR